ncbi:MAG: hypothetical protein KIT18_00950 [Burkholderiales bacterium]|nr:hypothetical protein [Burkholderiales bacterium]
MLAAFAAGTNFGAISQSVREWAKLLMLDAVGNAYASTRFEFAHRALTALQGLDLIAANILSSGMLGHLTLRIEFLMMERHVLVHGLDFDDTYLLPVPRI